MDNQTATEKIQNLLECMTLEEKIMQLTSVLSFDLSTPETLGIENGIGGMPIMGGTPEDIANNIKKIQDYVLDHSTHKIPVLFHCETLSGPLIAGCNLFPTSIGLGATFDPDVVKDMAQRCARQMAAMGIRQGLSPVVDIARDLRWGRIAETYGGDPTLCSVMGTAFVEGLQGEEGSSGVAATLKHFLGYSGSTGGLNMSRIATDWRDLRENFAKPFEAAIQKAHAKSVMNSYNEYNGQPICASKEILIDLLRNDLGFEGTVVSDYSSVERMVKVFHTSENMTEAGKKCLAAGLDMEFPNRVGFSKEMAADAACGKFNQKYIDLAVERVLKLKMELGLFDDPYPKFEQFAEIFDNTDNNRKSMEAAMKSMTLTKNNGILPIKNKAKRIAVIGPMGNSVRAFYSCYTLPASFEMRLRGKSDMAGVELDKTEGSMTAALGNHQMDLHIADDMIRQACPDVKTVFEALQNEFENIVWIEGCDYIGDQKNDYESAEKAAKEADIVIMTVGGRSGWGSYCTSGEGADSSQIGLPGNQESLIRKVFKVNPNMVIVHTDCRPIISEWIYEHVPAILEAWFPCTYGGIAIAKTLIGENTPGGRLQLDVPRNSSHGPIGHYFSRGTEPDSFSALAVNKDGYLDINMRPQLPFGFGLSYTSFEYSECTLKIDGNNNIIVSATIENTGDCAGDEVVQLYGSDKFSSIVRPERELLGFKRITLNPREKKSVQFYFNINIMAFYDRPSHWIVEKGEFNFYIGKNSQEKIWEHSIWIDESYEIDHHKRDFFALAKVI